MYRNIKHVENNKWVYVKFIYSEKATKFCKIFPLLLTVCTVVKSKGKISQNFVAFSEYMNFTTRVLGLYWLFMQRQICKFFRFINKSFNSLLTLNIGISAKIVPQFGLKNFFSCVFDTTQSIRSKVCSWLKQCFILDKFSLLFQVIFRLTSADIR